MSSGGVTLDSGALIAVERGNRQVLSLIQRALDGGLEVHIPAGVIAQVWRGGARQALLARLINATQVTEVALDGDTAREVGVLCGVSGHPDVVDVHVVLHALQEGHRIVTSDPDDLRKVTGSAELIVV